MEQPRVDPSDWASRRQNAMNRAKELRSKLKERETTQNDSTSSGHGAPSKADIQRQRRSRQLEETQRLLNINNFGGETNPTNEDAGIGSQRRATQDGIVYHKDLKSNELDSHSVVSIKQLGRIRSKNFHSDKSLDKIKSTDYASLTKGRSVTRNGTFVDTTKSRDAQVSTLRDRPVELVEGRGRGRGRGRITTAGSHSSSLGEMPQSSRSISSKQLTNQSSEEEISNDKQSATMLLQSYLRERRVPAYKEGECEKLTILRQNLVARRKMRSNEIMDSENKENNARLGRSAGYTMQAAGTPFDSLQLKISRDAEPQVQLQQMSLEDDATAASHSDNGSCVIKDSSNKLDDDEFVEIELIKCECCKRSFAPKVYEKHVDDDGQPKCLTQMSKKRAVFNSAKVRDAKPLASDLRAKCVSSPILL